MDNQKESAFKKFFSAKTALWFGVLLFLTGIQNPTYFVAGIVTMLGATACLSVDKRKVKPSTYRFIIELILVAIIVISVLFHNRQLLVEDPLPNLIIPAWAVIAYIVKVSKNK